MSMAWHFIVITRAITIAVLSAFTLGIPHATSTPVVTGTSHSHHETSNAAMCQSICGSGVINTQKPDIRKKSEEDDYGLDLLQFVAGTLAGFCATIIGPRFLYLLSSWRPPDKVLLFGHYADGL